MKNFIDQNKNPIIFLIIIGIIVFVYNYIDKDLSKVLGIASFFVWFLRGYFKNLLDKDLEKHKHQLQNEQDRLKIQYKKLHAERAEVIKNFYQRMIKVTREVRRLILTLDYEEKGRGRHKFNQIAGEHDNLINYYEINDLYFENDIQDVSQKLLGELTKFFIMFGYLKFNQQMGRFNKDLMDVDKMTKSEFNLMKKNLEKEIDTNIPLLKKKLEKKFKNIIGVEEKVEL